MLPVYTVLALNDLTTSGMEAVSLSSLRRVLIESEALFKSSESLGTKEANVGISIYNSERNSVIVFEANKEFSEVKLE